MHPRFDFTFSYWIFSWFILYTLGIIPFNPKQWLLLGLTINVISFFYTIVQYNIDWILLFHEIIINIFIKIIPIWILYKSKTTLYDFLFGIFLCLLYIFYLWFSCGSITNIRKYQNYIWNKKIHNEISTPLLYYLYYKID
jgi:hypothetical protein